MPSDPSEATGEADEAAAETPAGATEPATTGASTYGTDAVAGGASAAGRDAGAAEPPHHRPRPAGAIPGAGRRSRRSRRLGLADARIGRWPAPLAVLLLCVLAWELPFYEPPPEGAGYATPELVVVPHAHPALEPAPLLRIDARVVSLDGRRIASAEDVDRRGEDALGALAEGLEVARRNAAFVRPDAPWPRRVALFVARGTRWGRVRPVLLAAARAGAPRIAFAVRAGPSEAPPFDWSRFARR